MQKIYVCWRYLPAGIVPAKLWHVMRLIMILLFVGLVSAHGKTYSQNAPLNVRVTNAPLPELFRQIQAQSNWRIFYKDELLRGEKNITLHLRGKRLVEVLDKALDGTSLGYTIVGTQVAIVPKEEQPVRPLKLAREDSLLTIKGRVYDTHEPPVALPGVTIGVKGTSRGTTSDADGYFTIQAPKNATLVFSLVGFIATEYNVLRSNTGLSIALNEKVSALDEVVVVGITEQQRKHIASAVASLNVKSAMSGKPITTISQSLQGGVTGLQVSQSSGLPGGDAATIKIRGITSLNGSNPLVLVDGIPMDMNFIDPLTVESVTVLKDAAAASIYGARAASGVILVTTKRGTPGRVAVTYDGYYGVQSPTKMPALVDAPQYMRMYNEALANSGKTPLYSEDDIQQTIAGTDPVKYPNTDWQKVIVNKQAPITSHSVGVSGGNSLARFALNANYQYQDGMTPLTSSRKYNIRANTSVSLAKNFQINMDLLAIKRNILLPNRTLGHDGTRLLEDVFRVPPTILPKYPQKEGSADIYGRYVDIVNPLAYAEKGGRFVNEYGQSSINLQPKWEVIPGLNLRGQFSYRLNSDLLGSLRDNYNFFDYYTGQLLQTWTQQRAYTQARTTYYYIAANADYTLELKDHHFFLMAGYSQEEKNTSASTAGTYLYINSLLSSYAKLNYSYQDRYLLELTGRMDASSKFDKGHKYGFFPSVALGWNISKEKFMSSLKAVSNMKLRASYGQLGNESDVDLYQYQTTINSGSGLETNYGNPDLSWETVNMADVGLDIGLFNNKLEIVVDYYNKLTKDIILRPPLSFTGGFEDKVPVNAGKLRNTGWEASVNYNGNIGKNVSVSFRPGVTYNKNEIVSLLSGPYVSATSIQREGGPYGGIFGYKTAGLLQASDFDKDGNPLVPVLPGAKPGDIKYLDISGNKIIDGSDQTLIGNPIARLNYFANFRVAYKNFDLEFLLQGTGKSDVVLAGMLALPMDNSKDGGVPTRFYADNYWTPERTNAMFPRLNTLPTNNKLSSDFWFQNGAYMRVKYIQLGYNTQADWLKRAGIRGLRVYVNAQNPITFTKMKLTDAESQGDQWTYGIMKAFIAGINVQL
ncbi:TonB-dependent receptor [Chitinophaga varians]|uniref:TonB-dependent receptor n=1 Tax=Chitinophaga varians TaxID=2202339 RepID=UPI00165F9628|nr:TonB-dependent receptor [Chitinophaga varians]MBC9915197.1 TonB-dependent receptor [Chitinophaga varians]